MLNNQKIFFEKDNNYLVGYYVSPVEKAGKLNVFKGSTLLMPQPIFAT